MKSFIFFLLLAVTLTAYSQDLPREVLASGGEEHSSTAATVSWTLGEVVIATHEHSGLILTQGFQQGNLTVSSLVHKDLLDFNLKAYPNPVIDILFLETDKKQHSYQLINMQGELVLNGEIINALEEIDFTNLPRGIYLLSVDQKQTHKIIKQ